MKRRITPPVSGLHILLLGCMSSGKSTILNALLGKGDFPAGNRATTAQIFKIMHDPECDEPLCRNPSTEGDWQPLSNERLKEWNGTMKENVPAEVLLRFPHLQKKRPVVIYDTPGPNTSRYAEHRAETYYALERLPLTHIFLVLDMAQLHTKDEEALLADMGKVMKARGGLPLLVILNKADVIDIEKESVEEIIGEIRETVSQHVPAGTRIDILPVMAKGTEVWRRMIEHDTLTSFEIEFAQYIDWRLCEDIRIHALIPEDVRTSVSEQMEEWRRLQKFSQAFRSSLEYIAKRIHPGAELINRSVSRIHDYADCRRAITGSGIIALEEYIDALSPDWNRASQKAQPVMTEAAPRKNEEPSAGSAGAGTLTVPIESPTDPSVRNAASSDAPAAPNRDTALALLRKYNKDVFHIQHALTVEAVMRHLARELGYADEADFWAAAGLLHDIDFENWPDRHCLKAPELLAEIGADERLVHAVCSHGFGLCCDVEPVHEMEKVLFAVDELTGLIGAAALMRPSRSTSDMEISSLKKKFKDKKFAAGCSRDVIRSGAERLGWTLDRLLETALGAMKATEAGIREELSRSDS
ncbi:MAG: dynamin family protein [Mailhella sp.]|nr:dynamin family protein [Mailhella sp.]